MIQKTKGIVLRTVKYGETSIIATIFTEVFGVQSYLVNGVRSQTKRSVPKAAHFQPAVILDLVVYHTEYKNLHRIKEFGWSYLYKNLLSDVHKNAVALFMVELVSKCLKEPETNDALFYFTEQCLHQLDEANTAVTANFPLFFALHLASFFGFGISDEYTSDKTFLDLQEGSFVTTQPNHTNYMQDREAAAVSQILAIRNTLLLDGLSLSQESRRRIMHTLEGYYALHLPDFGTLRTLPVLREIMS
jgi:DNA repair protein RecO (recombination protein O)